MGSLRIDKRVLTLLVLGLLLILVFLYFFVDLPETIRAISSADPLLLLLALLSVLLGVFFYALTWEVILRAVSEPLGIWRAFQYVCTSIFLSIILPAGTLTGETTRAFLTVKNSNNNPGSVVASIISHRTLDMIPFLGGSCIALLFMYMNHQFLGYTIYLVSSLIFLVILTISLVLYLALRPQRTEGILNILFKLVARVYRNPERLEKWREEASKQLRIFHEGIERLTLRPSTLPTALLCSALSYSADIIAIRLIFRALGLEAPFSVILTAYTIAIAIQTIPVGLPGMTGPVEISMITVYSLAGIPPATGAAATIIMRCMNLWFEMALGAVMAYWVGLKALEGGS